MFHQHDLESQTEENKCFEATRDKCVSFPHYVKANSGVFINKTLKKKGITVAI